MCSVEVECSSQGTRITGKVEVSGERSTYIRRLMYFLTCLNESP